MQEDRQQITSRGKLGALARILKNFKFLKKVYHTNILGIIIIKEHL